MHRLSLILLILLGGCAETKYVATSQPFCISIRTVCISKDDQLTGPTATQIEGNNLARAKLCPRQRVVCKQPVPRS